MKKINKRAAASTLYMLIIGILLFVMVSCAVANGFIGAFKSYKGAEQSTDELMTAMIDVANDSKQLSLRLVGVEMEEDAAIFLFSKNTDLKMGFTSYSLNNPINSEMLIVKPSECAFENQCICLCKEMELISLGDGKNMDELNELNELYGKYDGVAPRDMFELKCKNSIDCTVLNDTSFPDRITLSEVISDEDYEIIEEAAKIQQRKFINVWEGGFALWRLSDSRRQQFLPTQFMKSKYADLYVVNNNVNVKLCLDPKCAEISAAGSP